MLDDLTDMNALSVKVYNDFAAAGLKHTVCNVNLQAYESAKLCLL